VADLKKTQEQTLLFTDDQIETAGLDVCQIRERFGS
jgi:hypothetical protein